MPGVLWPLGGGLGDAESPSSAAVAPVCVRVGRTWLGDRPWRTTSPLGCGVAFSPIRDNDEAPAYSGFCEESKVVGQGLSWSILEGATRGRKGLP